MGKPQNNIALIDGQNLHLGTKTDGWILDHKKFKVYLSDKYGVKEAHYFMGYLKHEYNDLYISLQKSGYLLHHREYHEYATSQKKGNVDSNIIFFAMRLLVEQENFDKLVLVSGDGDYFDLVKYFIKKQKFEKILFPSRNSRSLLYKKVSTTHFDYLYKCRQKILYKTFK